MAPLLSTFTRPVFDLIQEFLDYIDLEYLWMTGNTSLQHHLARKRELFVDQAPTSNGKFGFIRYLNQLRSLTVTSKMSAIFSSHPLKVSNLAQTLEKLDLNCDFSSTSILDPPDGDTLANLFPHLQELKCVDSKFGSKNFENTLQSLPPSLTRLLLHVPHSASNSTLNQLPRGLTDLHLSINASGAPIHFPPSLVYLSVIVNNSPQSVYKHLPSNLLSLVDRTMWFGIPPSIHFLPPTLLAYDCLTHVVSASFIQNLPPQLLFLRLSCQQHLPIEALQALPRTLRFLSLRTSWSQWACSAPIDQILGALPESLTEIDAHLFSPESKKFLPLLVLSPSLLPLGPLTTVSEVLVARDQLVPGGKLEILSLPIQAENSELLFYWSIPERFRYAHLTVNDYNDESLAKLPKTTSGLAFARDLIVEPPGSFCDSIRGLNHLVTLNTAHIPSLDFSDLKSPLKTLIVHAKTRLPEPLPHTLTELKIEGQTDSWKYDHTLPPHLESLTITMCDIPVELLPSLLSPPKLRSVSLSTLIGTFKRSYFDNLPSRLETLHLSLQENNFFAALQNGSQFPRSLLTITFLLSSIDEDAYRTFGNTLPSWMAGRIWVHVRSGPYIPVATA